MEESPVVDDTQKQIIEWSLDYWKFAYDCLGFKEMNKVHQELCSFLQRPKKFKIILLPRYSFKSCVITQGLALWKLIRNTNERILIYSDTASKAQGFLLGVKNHIEGRAYRSKFRDTFGVWETDSHKGKWNESQIIIRTRDFAHVEPTIDTGGIETTKVGMHYDTIFFDDIVSDVNITTKEQMDKVAECYQKSLSLLKPGGEVIIVGCLIGSSKVTMADGTQRDIKDVRVGEKVISYKYDREHSIEVVEAMVPQGEDDVFELKTGNETIYATANHPFMTKNGFVKLEDLKAGDKIYGLSYLPRIKKTEFDYDDLYVLGYMLGDGWLTERKSTAGCITCFAFGSDEEINNNMCSLIENKTGCKPKITKFGYARYDRKCVSDYIKSLGFKGKAKTKRLPKYLFSLSVKMKQAVLDGLIDSDGWVDKINHIEMCNNDLVYDIKVLARSCGYKVSNIYSRTRIIQAPHSKAPIKTESHHISIGNKKRIKRFCLQTIKSIKHVGRQEVFDLTISNTHNFIAEGLVVHNTRWHFGDLYGRLLKENDDNKIFDTFIKSCYEKNEEEKLIFEDIGLDHEFLDAQKKRQGSYIFSCLYENSPVDDLTATFKVSDFRFYQKLKESDKAWEKGLFPNLYVTGTCDPAGQGEDDTAITVVGTDNNLRMHVLDIVSAHLQPNQIVDEVFRLNNKYHFKRFGIETTFFRGMLMKELETRMQEEGNKQGFNYFSIEEFKTRWRKGEGKDVRIRGLQPFHERGDILFPGKSFEELKGDFKELAWQMIQFPKASHDDIIDSLAWHVELVQKGGVAKKAGPPKLSPAWLEENFIHAFEEKSRKYPKRHRKQLVRSLS